MKPERMEPWKQYPKSCAESDSGVELRTALKLIKHFRASHPEPIEENLQLSQVAKEILREIVHYLGPAGRPCSRCRGSGREPK